MGYELDLDDVAATHPKALAELEALRAERAELYQEQERLRDKLARARLDAFREINKAHKGAA